ncbi:MAG: oligoendopeptidase F [Actinobacteria bacterium]|nr:oligoendopeptidase F [Actinomycetota bacterium]
MNTDSLKLFSPSENVQKGSKEAKTDLANTWNLEDIYPSDNAWIKAKTEFNSKSHDILKFKDKLGQSAALLFECLNLNSEFSKQLDRLHSYASMRFDQNTGEAKYLSFSEEMEHLAIDYQSMVSFIEPEILAIDEKIIFSFLQQDSRLKVYGFFLQDLLRKKKHTLSENEEKILAQAEMMATGPYTIFSVFSNAELPYPKLKLSSGKTVLLNKSGYSQYRAVADRKDRKRVFDAFFGKLATFQSTFGTQLYANIKKDIFYSRSRGYKSSLERALFRNTIPKEVYYSLIDNVNSHLSTFHRYLNLKKRLLNVDTLHYYDTYAPVVKGLDLNYSIEEAKELVIDSLAPLGKKYVKIAKQGMYNRWIDVYPTTGKRSGAYSNGSVYDVHPFILMNFNGLFEDVSTLAHELGHAMHSYFSNKTQPYPMAGYAIFVAEVASTFNEMLLINNQSSLLKDDETRLSLLMNYLDRFKGTVFRQTQFAEYELQIHNIAERGKALTGETLTKVYANLVKKYYGSNEGVCSIDDRYTVEWAFIPHFYYNFYVYQYATSFAASTFLVEKLLRGEKQIIEQYLKFLSSGGSDYPINLLKNVGVDMTSEEPFATTIKVMERTMDEIESILEKREKAGG